MLGLGYKPMCLVMRNMSPVEWGMNKDITIDYETEPGGSNRI